MGRCSLAIVALLLCTAPLGAAEPKPVWLLVGSKPLLEAVGPLVEHRRAEGFEVVLSGPPVERAIGAAPRRPEFVLLLGDDEPGREDQPWYLPAKQCELYRWREAQRRRFVSDAVYGDVDGDLVPDIPVGRIPARTAEEVGAVVRKIIAFEGRQPNERDLRLNIWTGSPNYGPLIDSMATGMLLGAVEAAAPKWAEPWFISGDPAHPLCGWPPEQPKAFTARMGEGSILNVLMGHAAADRFFSMQHGDRPIWYTAADAAEALSKGPPAAPMIVFSCESGRFDGQSPCLAESFLFMPAGPVAAVAATTESHPLTNYFSGQALLAAFDGKQPRLGSMWLAAGRRASAARNLLIERLLRDVEGKLEPEIDLEKLRRDQLLMYALLGDPATRLRFPEPLKATIERADDGWRWRAVRPPGATALQVGFRANQQKLPPPDLVNDPQAAREAFHVANARFAFHRLDAPAEEEAWTGSVDRPGWLRLVATGPDGVDVAVLRVE